MRSYTLGPVDVDGVPVTIESDSETLDELREQIKELKTQAADETDDGSPPGEPGEVKPPPKVFDRPFGNMDVSEGTGKPGELVAINLYGFTDVPVNGWMAAIGYESNKVEVLGVEWGSFLQQNGRRGTPFWRARPRGHPRIGNAGAHIQLAYTSWVLSVPLDTPVDEIDPDTEGIVPTSGDKDGDGFADALLIPPETILATIRFQIKDNARPGDVVPLLNWPGKFGKVKVHHVYTRVRSTGITPETEDGSITVLEP